MLCLYILLRRLNRITMNKKLVSMTREEIMDELKEGKSDFISSHRLELMLLSMRERYDKNLWILPKGETSALHLPITHLDLDKNS